MPKNIFGKECPVFLYLFTPPVYACQGLLFGEYRFLCLSLLFRHEKASHTTIGCSAGMIGMTRLFALKRFNLSKRIKWRCLRIEVGLDIEKWFSLFRPDLFILPDNRTVHFHFKQPGILSWQQNRHQPGLA